MCALLWSWIVISIKTATPQEELALFWLSLLPQSCLQVISLLSIVLVGLH